MALDRLALSYTCSIFIMLVFFAGFLWEGRVWVLEGLRVIRAPQQPNPSMFGGRRGCFVSFGLVGVLEGLG